MWTEKKRLTDRYTALLVVVGQTVRDPSSQNFVVAERIEMIRDGRITAAESRRQFTRGGFRILLEAAKNFVVIDSRWSTGPFFVFEARISGSEAIKPAFDCALRHHVLLACAVDVGGCRAWAVALEPLVVDKRSNSLLIIAITVWKIRNVNKQKFALFPPAIIGNYSFPPAIIHSQPRIILSHQQLLIPMLNYSPHA
jgi:hypothetical protein